MHLGLCVMVYLCCHTHTYLRAPYKTPPGPEQSQCLPSPPPQACAEGNFFILLFYIFISPLTQVLWHGPSFLHGGLVWNYFLAYDDFLARGWVRWVGRWGQRYCCCNSTGEETFFPWLAALLFIPCPIPSAVSSPLVPKSVLLFSLPLTSDRPSVLLAPRHSSLPVSPPLEIPALKRHLSSSKSYVVLHREPI